MSGPGLQTNLLNIVSLSEFTDLVTKKFRTIQEHGRDKRCKTTFYSTLMKRQILVILEDLTKSIFKHLED